MALAGGYADALDGLRVTATVAPPGRVTPVADLALERALVADPVLASAGVDRWLGPLEGAARGGPELVRTLEAWLEAGESVVASARILGVAPRTVSYRLERVASILGVPTLDADHRARLSAAILVRRPASGIRRQRGTVGPGSIGPVSELRPSSPVRRPDTARSRTAEAHRHDQPQAVAPPPSVEPATLEELVRIQRHMASLPVHVGADITQDDIPGRAARPPAGWWRRAQLCRDAPLGRRGLACFPRPVGTAHASRGGVAFAAAGRPP